MARLPVQAAAGLTRRLFHSSSNNEAFKRVASSSERSASSITCVLWPLATPLLSHTAFGSAAFGHAYHRGGNGSSTDEEQHSSSSSSSSVAEASGSSSSSKDIKSGSKASSSTSSSSKRSSDSNDNTPATPQLSAIRQAIQQERERNSDRHEAQQLPERVARIAMRDPLGVLISSLGVPLGISLKVNRNAEVLQQAGEDDDDDADKRSALDEFDMRLGVQEDLRQESARIHAQLRAMSERFAAEAKSTGSAAAAAVFTEQGEQDEEDSEAEEEARAWQEGLDDMFVEAVRSGRGGGGDSSTSVPDTDMQLHQQELHQRTRSFARRQRQRRQTAKSREREAAAAAEGGGNDATAGTAAAAGGGPAASDVHQHLESLRAMILRASSSGASGGSGDSWGTTQQSPAEIAQQIADSNRAAAGGGGGGGDDGDDGEGGSDADDDGDAALTLSPGEERYADASAVAADLKEMDEIFEVLAKVPWLDGEDVDERELRGLAAVGLLGTLEEVGWTIRDKLIALWGGERDEGVLTAGLGPREASAMASILYHTQQLEAQYGKPPPESVEAALEAASMGGGGGAGGEGEQ